VVFGKDTKNKLSGAFNDNEKLLRWLDRYLRKNNQAIEDNKTIRIESNIDESFKSFYADTLFLFGIRKKKDQFYFYARLPDDNFLH